MAATAVFPLTPIGGVAWPPVLSPQQTTPPVSFRIAQLVPFPAAMALIAAKPEGVASVPQHVMNLDWERIPQPCRSPTAMARNVPGGGNVWK